VGINIKKKDAPAAEDPAPVTAADTPAPKKGGIQIGKKSVAEVLKETPAEAAKADPSKPILGSATVTKDNIHKGTIVDTEQTQQKVVVPPSSAQATSDAQALCRITVDASYTHNLGNYNSTRIGVSLSVPCAADEIDEVYEFVEGWCNTKMQAAVSGLTGSGE
jgi:hypothetical protein